MGVTYNSGPVVPAQAQFTGNDQLKTGYVVCHDILQTDGSQEYKVAKPTAANIEVPFGIISPDSDGKQGPSLVDILRPGSVAQVFVKENCVAGATHLKIVAGQYFLIAAGVGDEYYAVALQTVDTSSAAGLVLCSILSNGRA